jgi:hypothetical protein
MERMGDMNMLRGLSIVLLLTMGLAQASDKNDAPLGDKERKFQFTYTATIKEVPDTAKTVELWIPVPQNNKHQKISDVKFELRQRTAIELKDKKGESVAVDVEIDKKPKIKTESTYDNKMAYWKLSADEARNLSVVMSFECERHEAAASDISKARALTGSEQKDMELWLQANKLVLVGGDFVATADTATKGAKTPNEIAKAAYDYTVGTMKYDKPKDKPGWGKGSTQWACDSKFGNCTDFHAMIMSIGRTKGIPVKFEMGFPIPNHDPAKPETSAGPIGGYHCWAKFYLGGVGWVPVDASEAQKFADKRDYYFGHLCENRVQLSSGRDVNLVPKQAGEPLNYFIYPYAEADGKSITVEKAFAFKDVK